MFSDIYIYIFFFENEKIAFPAGFPVVAKFVCVAGPVPQVG